MKTKINRRLLKQLRQRRGWALDRAAVEIGISRQALHYIERGMVQPRATTLHGIARAYGVPMSAFYSETVSA